MMIMNQPANHDLFRAIHLLAVFHFQYRRFRTGHARLDKKEKRLHELLHVGHDVGCNVVPVFWSTHSGVRH